jgi:hypothetical protein
MTIEVVSKEQNMTIEVVSKYEEFIREAFISPIRSVLIIDDEYPTIEQVLLSQINGSTLKSYKNPLQILNVVKRFREDHPALIVDIHDGSKDESAELARYLHQSDLLILDYELGDSGAKSVEITKKILSNSHFNLIIVHTNTEPTEPFESHLLALLERCETLSTQPMADRISAGQELIGIAEDRDSDIAEKVKNTVGFQQYMHFRHPSNKRAIRSACNGEAPFGDFKTLCEQFSWTREEPSNIFAWALMQYEEHNKESFDKATTAAQNWSQVSSDRLWVRTNKGFITFVKKGNNIKLIDELIASLQDWRPSPSRLMSAMLRAELDDQGVIAEDLVLESKLLHAKFYKDLFGKTTDESMQVAIDAQVGRHFEDMGNLIKKRVMPAMKELVKEDKAGGGDSEFIKHYGVDISGDTNKAATDKFNSYVSCYPEVIGWHLAPGHILNINEEKWVCLSPVCDLVPGQKSIGIYGHVGKGKPFLAVKLHKRNGDVHKSQINSNNFLFLPAMSNPGAVEKYGFYDGSGDDPDKSLSPHWSLFIAKKGGKFEPDKKIISISKIDCVVPARRLKFKQYRCEIIAQLRYEYALNLMQKLGSDQTRVGLGYLSS